MRVSRLGRLMLFIMFIDNFPEQAIALWFEALAAAGTRSAKFFVKRARLPQCQGRCGLLKRFFQFSFRNAFAAACVHVDIIQKIRIICNEIFFRFLEGSLFPYSKTRSKIISTCLI